LVMAFTWFKKNKDVKEEETVPAEDVFQAETKTQDPMVPPLSTEKDQGKSTGFFNRLKKGLSKTHKVLSTDINELFSGNRKIDDGLLEELEELLITSDIGVRTAMDLIQSISKRSSEISGADQLKKALKEKILAVLNSEKLAPQKIRSRPHVIMVIGVNGVGKTTTIGKLAAKFAASGEKVIITACDTFRAAAIEQLEIWAQRAGVEIVKHKEMSDPAAVAYDGIEAAVARGAGVVIVDTAGRIHTRKNLMEELKKIKRAISKKLPEAPHEILLVLDATTGQNAISQAELFNDALDVTGIALTKLDGTAKGGIVVSICSMLEIPLKYIGIGEEIEDLQEFDSVRFVNALF
jgi:fused signal recognition particle receptor